MTADVSNFYYGAVTPVAAYLMACLGAALGLRCTTRSLRRPERRAAWLALGAVSIGCGVWSMHFIAMMGFNVQGALVDYDPVKTLLSLALAIVVVAIGVFLVGYRGGSPVNLGAAGTFTGLGVAGMHYLGMAAMHTNGTLHYDTPTVALSVVIAIGAATAALWAALSLHTLWSSLVASLVMGVAVSGMHYTGMAAVSVHLTGGPVPEQSSIGLLSFLLAMLAGPLVALLIAAVIVMFDPDVMFGDGVRDPATAAPYGSGTDSPVQQPEQPSQPYTRR
ncbi:MHYT domain-containing protein [Streptomyces kebangsaanensis]|uniref:MHYT domain-containing protein n=1 Tax=Streptomyces kebangsaanensis TaxID=864058 RepID=UPI0009396F00|nr:MHYT domain-containing protein [Streptomyces kebangsaanensis]